MCWRVNGRLPRRRKCWNIRGLSSATVVSTVVSTVGLEKQKRIVYFAIVLINLFRQTISKAVVHEIVRINMRLADLIAEVNREMRRVFERIFYYYPRVYFAAETYSLARYIRRICWCPREMTHTSHAKYLATAPWRQIINNRRWCSMFKLRATYAKVCRYSCKSKQCSDKWCGLCRPLFSIAC